MGGPGVGLLTWPEEELGPVVTLRPACFPRCLSSRSELVRAANLLLSLRTSHRASQFEKGRAASYLCEFCPGPPRERERALGGFWHIPPEGSLGRSLCTTPSAGPGVHEGGAGAGVSAFSALACAVCLPPEGWVLLIHR